MRKFVFTLFFFCIALLPLFSLDDAQAVKVSAKNVWTIIIDPAHGGVDPGAIGHHTINGDEVTFLEKDMTLQIALILKEKIAKILPDMNVILTRNDDIYLSLEDRMAQANTATLGNGGLSIFVSIHMNGSYTQSTRGYQFYVPLTGYNANNIALAERVSLEFNYMFGNEFPCLGIVKENTYMPDNGPLALLAELGFITNPKDIILLHSEQGLEKCATALAFGIASYIVSF